MEDKTIKPEFQKANKSIPEKPKRNYSHKQLITSLDRHIAVAKQPEDKKAILDIKDRYVQDQDKTAINRIDQRIHLRQGFRAGIHDPKTLDRMEQNEQAADQVKRDKTMVQAKTYYHRNYSVSKGFRDVSKGRSRDKSMNRE